MNKLAVTMIFPSPWLVSRVFPESLGRYLTEQYRAKGVEVLAGDVPAFDSDATAGGYVARTRARPRDSHGPCRRGHRRHSRILRWRRPRGCRPAMA